MPLKDEDIDSIILQKTGKKFEELIKKQVINKSNELELEEIYKNLDNTSKKIIEKHFNLYGSYICCECNKPVYIFGYCIKHYILFFSNIKEEIEYIKQDINRFKNYCSFLNFYKKNASVKIKNKNNFILDFSINRKIDKLLYYIIENIRNEKYKINIFEKYDVEEICGNNKLEVYFTRDITSVLHLQEKIKIYKKYINIINNLENIEDLLDTYKIDSFKDYYNNYSIYEYIFSHLNKIKVKELCHNLEIIEELYNYEFVLELDCYGLIYNNIINNYIPFAILIDDDMCDKRLYCLLRGISFIYFENTNKMKSDINKFLEQLHETEKILAINV